jgi:TonB family protein
MKCALPLEMALLLFCGVPLFAQTTPSSTEQNPQSPATYGSGSGGGVFRVGGDVSAPKAVYQPDPEYSKEARKAKYGGTCILWLIVGADGLTHDIRVARSLGLGLDEKAIEAVKRWKFEPAMKDGKPVSVQANISVGFHLYGPSSTSPLDVLSDTMGVDFGPYLQGVLATIRKNWQNLIPSEARAPTMKKGTVSIEFTILADGKVEGVKIVGTSGDAALDRAAWGGITASEPFPPLPTEFGGKYLALRIYYYYNRLPTANRPPE